MTGRTPSAWRRVGTVVALMLASGMAAGAAEPPVASADFTYRQLLYGVHRRLPADRLDRDNVLRVPRSEILLRSRPDAQLVADPLTLSLQPRLDLRRSEYGHGSRPGAPDTEVDLYFQQLLVQLEPVDYLFLSAGQETVVWGPSFLLSPSNPFGMATGRLEPKEELPPSQFVTLQWVPSLAWSATLIANTERGRRSRYEDFRRGAAFKLDRFSDHFHGAVIVSKQEGRAGRLGGFGSVHLSEAALGYIEAGAGRYDALALAGIRYTTWQHWMWSAEYLYQSHGDRHTPVSGMVPDIDQLSSVDWDEAFDTLPWMQRAAAVQPASGYGMPRWSDVTTGGLLRRNYLLLQAAYPQWRRRVDLLLQHVYNIDDRSGRALVFVECVAGRHTRLFASGMLYHGHRESEFGSVLETVGMGGVEWVF